MAKHIQPEKARALAYEWHGGMYSPLYAFASSGLIASHLALLGEIRECERLAETVTDKRKVRALYRFARDCVARIHDERYPHAAPWAKGE